MDKSKSKKLLQKIKEIEKYLGPIMNYNDDGIFRLLKKGKKQDVWIYEYYQILKKKYYKK
jgi:hypothetical protein